MSFILDNSIPRTNVSARQRRREHRLHASVNATEDDNKAPPTPPVYDRSISNDSQIDAVEQERKAKQDMNDFLDQLHATLRIPSVPSTPAAAEIPSMFDRTMMSTSKLEERRDALRENCLQEMTEDELQKVLDLLDLVSEADIKKEMISILGEDIFEKYCAQIYALKYHENSIYTRK